MLDNNLSLAEATHEFVHHRCHYVFGLINAEDCLEYTHDNYVFACRIVEQAVIGQVQCSMNLLCAKIDERYLLYFLAGEAAENGFEQIMLVRHLWAYTLDHDPALNDYYTMTQDERFDAEQAFTVGVCVGFVSHISRFRTEAWQLALEDERIELAIGGDQE